MGFNNFFHKRLCPKAKFKRESLLATKETAVRGLSGDVRLPLLKTHESALLTFKCSFAVWMSDTKTLPVIHVQGLHKSKFRLQEENEV